MPGELIIRDLGLISYRQAWTEQEIVHQRVVDGASPEILLVEHPPVITFGRRPSAQQNLLVTEDKLAQLGVDVVQSDRGGDITFHGPGQIVAYPIIRLAHHGLSVSGYVHRLESIVIAALSSVGVCAEADPSAVGIWVGGAKIAAIGVRIRRGVTLHGLALNVCTDLDFFNLIVPCGLARPVTSLQELMENRRPSMDEMKRVLSAHLARGFA